MSALADAGFRAVALDQRGYNQSDERFRRSFGEKGIRTVLRDTGAG
jgi:hypothetical protein